MQEAAADKPEQPNSSSADRVRLHITPFNPTLLGKILPSSVQALASDISFHTVQTFPERGFGFVELPVMEAQKLKKKLNGSTLKGSKVRIENARVEKKKRKSENEEGVVADAGGDRKVRKTAEKGKRKEQQRDDGAIAGHEIPEGRRVKRGWTDKNEEGNKRSSRRNKSTEDTSQNLEGKKLRFKTSLPPNVSPVETESKASSKKRDKSKEGKAEKKKKVVVEEFSKKSKVPLTSAPAESTARGASTFEDGRGWVDEAGNIVETAPQSQRPNMDNRGEESERRISAIESMETADLPVAQHPVNATLTLEEEAEENLLDAAVTPDPDINTGAEAGPEFEKEIHPLEALFKRPATRSSNSKSNSISNAGNNKPRPKPIDTSFSFFDTADNNNAANLDEDVAMEGDDHGIIERRGNITTTNMHGPVPQTPHTKRDLEWRSIRSAAPTPDTAAIGRHFSFPGFGGEDDDDEEYEDEVEGGVDGDGGGGGEMEGVVEDAIATDGGEARGGGNEKGEESVFRKWFYENRGDLNRGWKKRRREEKKIVRQRENRRVGRRVA